MRDINIKSIAKTFVILMIGLVSRYGVSGQMPTVAAGHTIRVHATGGLLAGKYLRGIVADPISGNVFVAASTVAPVINQCCYALPNFSLYKVTPAGVVSLVGTYSFQHFEIIKMAWGPDGLIYTADLSTGTIRTIDPVTAASAIYSTNGLYSNSRYGLQFDPSGNLIYSPEAISTFYKVTPAGPVTLGNVTASLPNGNHGDAFGIQPNGNYIVYPDCGGQNVYSINTAGHITGTNYTSVAWTGTSNLLTNTFYGAGACAYSNGAIDPYTGDVYSIIANAGNGIPRIVYTPAIGGGSSVFVSEAGNGGTPNYQVGSGITDLVFGKATNGCSKSLFFVDMTKNTVYEVIPVCSQPPAISCPSNITVSNTPGICGANVAYPIATVTGNPAPTVIYSNASGSFFPVGTTTVTVSASDGIGNTATCSFTVTVTGGADTDNDGTVNVCDPDDDNDGTIDESDCAPLDAIKWQQAFLYIDNDNDGYTNGQQTVCYGETIPVGFKATSLGNDCNDNNSAVNPGTTEICNDIDDDCDGSIDEGFINTVVTCPFTGTVTKNLSSGCTYTVNGNEFNATVTQNCGPLGYTLSSATTGTGTSLAGVQFNTGTTTVTWSAVNANGQSFTCSFNVYVVPTAPAIACPQNIIAPATNGQCGAIVNYTTPTLPNLCANNDDLPPTTVTFNYTGQIVNWTVPNGVTSIAIQTKGAQGGSINVSCIHTGGKGAIMKGTFPVTPGEVLKILVGQQGFSNGQDAGGGGGSFVVKNNNNPMIIAGGGGGASNNVNQCGTGPLDGLHAVTSTSGTASASGLAAGGTNGNGGVNFGGNGSAGAGFFTNGGTGAFAAPKSFLNGGAGGTGGSNDHGGFGGGGAGWFVGGNGGGGGGYSGGGTHGSNPYTGGGGGGSYNVGTNQENIAGVSGNTGNGIITITYSGGTQPAITQTSGLASGANFPVGTTTNTFQITDAFGQTSNCSFTVTVNDEQAPTVVQPSNIIVGNTIGQCSASVNFSASASDNCSVTNLKYHLNYNTPNQEEISFPKTFAVGSYVVTVVAKDAANNTTTKTFTITVNDTEKPTFTCPGNQNVNLNAACQLLVPDLVSGLTGSDNCATVTFTQSPVAGASLTSLHNQTHNVVITASDANGNTQTCTVVLTSKDVTKPIFICPDNLNVNLNGTCQLIVPNLIIGLTGSDNCGTVTFAQSPLAGASLTSSHNQAHNVVITANDGNGNTQTCTVVLTGKDVTKPTFICPDNQNINLNATCQLIVPNLIAGLTGSDNCGTVTFTQSPAAGAALPSSHNQAHNILITAIDGNGNTETCTVVLTGKDVTKPIFTYPGNQNVNLNGTCQLLVPNLLYGLTGNDNCGTVTFTQSPLAGASLVSSHNQTHNVLITAIDGNGNTQTCTVVLTGKDVTSPTFSCPGNQNINLTATCQLIVPSLILGLTGNDNCGTVTFTQSPLAGASLASSHNQTHNVLITANDGNGNTETCTVVLTGKDVTTPTFSCPGNQNINLTATCQLIVPNLITELSGNDNCGTVTFTQSPLAGASLASSHNQMHSVLITANDGNGNTQTCAVVLTGIDVTKPTFTCPYNQNVNLNGTCQLVVPNLISGLTGNDNCGTVTFTQSPVAGASLVSSHNQTHNVVITANDGNGNTQTCTVVLTGKDVTKPTFVCPNNRNVNLNGTCQLIVPSLIYGLTGNDNCGIVTFTQTPVAGTSFASSHDQTQNVLITANDGNGNIETCTVVLTAKDVTLPVITCPSPKTISCDASILPANTGSATAIDNCGGSPVITYSDVSGKDPDPSHAGYYNYTITRTWKAMDVATNTSTCNQTITVQDITKPMITCPADKLSVPFDFGQLYATIAIGTATATDNCAANANIAIAGTRSDNVVITNQQYPLGQTTVAWSATDPSDNSDGCTQTITVRKRNTAVTYTGDMVDSKICVQYSDIINLQAKLTDNEGLLTSNNISGRTITFQLLSGTTVLRSKTATTDANGVAIDTFKVEQAPGLYSVKTIFAGDGYFNGSNDQDNCEVKQEDADVEYNGSQYFTTSSSTTMAGSVTLAASLNDINDGSDVRGDIRKAKATFRDGGPGGNVLGSANLPVGLVNPNVLTNGLSATTQNYTLNTNEAGSGGKIFQVWVGASDHYKGADAGPTPVTLALPGLDFVTGGGHLVVTNSAGTYAGTLNSKMNFGFTMKWNKSGKSLQGNINIVFRKWQLYNGVWQWRVYQMKSNAINSMAVVEVGSNGQPVSGTNPAAFRKAIINTKANLKDVTDPLSNIDLGGNHNLTLDAWDHITANGGVSDKISVTLMGSTTNELLFSSSWLSNATQAQTITGGNINVRNGSLSSSTSINSITKNGQMEVAVKEDAFVVKAYPNPTEHEFTLIINSSLNEKIVIQLYDVVGRKIQTLSANANEIIRFGEKLKTGVYIAKVIQGNRNESVKLIKQ